MSNQMNKIRKEGWLKKQTGRYLKDWRFRYALIEGSYLKTFKKSNCKEETECIDLTQCKVKYDISTAQQFKLQYITEQFIFLCSNETDANQWIKEIYCVQLMVEMIKEKEREKKEMENDHENSYNIELESISDFDQEQLNVDHNSSLSPIHDIIEPQDDDDELKKDANINALFIDKKCMINDRYIADKLDIMRMLINNKENKNDQHLLNGLKVLINDCYIQRSIVCESIVCEWHLLKLNQHRHVMIKYIENKGPSVIKILHYILFNSLLIIYKHCDNENNAIQILNKYIKFEYGDYKIWRDLMEQQFVMKEYKRFCNETLRICKGLKKHNLYLYPSIIQGFDYDDIFNEEHIMMMDNMSNNCINNQFRKYYCSFPALSLQQIDIKINNKDIKKLLLTKIYVAM